jgi:hypothetical protein
LVLFLFAISHYLAEQFSIIIKPSSFTILEAEREKLPLVESVHEVNTHLPL